LKNSFHTESLFHERTWEQAVEEYGQGIGYRDRVLDIYRKELSRFGSIINIRDSYNSKWGEIIKENSLLTK
jgi:hypothetical protein